MSLLSLVLGELYIVSQGGDFLSFEAMIKTIAIILLSVLASSALVFFVVSFIKSLNAFSTASTLLGTLIGFFMGVYVPIGNLPDGVQLFVKCFPIAHSGVLLRKVMMEDAIASTMPGFTGEPLAEFRVFFGADFYIGDYLLPIWAHLFILGLTAVIFYGLTILFVSRRKTKE